MNFDPPASLPGSLRDQLRALAPYMTDVSWNIKGGFRIELTVPNDMFNGGIDIGFLQRNGLDLTMESRSMTSTACERVMGSSYTNFTLEYNF